MKLINVCGDILFCDSHSATRWYSVLTHSYLFSLALCLKSSMAFLNRVTLNSPLSLSSHSKLGKKITETGTGYTAVMTLVQQTLNIS